MKEKLRGSIFDKSCEAGSFCDIHCQGKCYHTDSITRQRNVEQLQDKLGLPDEERQKPYKCISLTNGGDSCAYAH